MSITNEDGAIGGAGSATLDALVSGVRESRKMTRREAEAELGRAWARADDAFWALDPDAPDAEIAEAIAECLVTTTGAPYILAVFHDVRPGTPKRIARLEKFVPGCTAGERFGPCPVRYDWSRKNLVGVKTRDREVAKRWAIEATLLGYSVFYQFGTISGSGFAKGTIAEVRERVRERQAWARGKEEVR
jgi:hypothetical protein